MATALRLTHAQSIIEGSLKAARAKGYKPMAVVVVDESGQVKAVQREDGATALRVEIATGKACAAFGMGSNSRKLAERARELPAFFSALASNARNGFLPQTGAVLVVSQDGDIMGAVGASGGTGDEDEEICIAGIKAAGFSAA